MSRSLLRRLVFAAAITLVAAGGVREASAEDVLLVGNSFSAGLKTTLGYLLRSAGREGSVSARAGRGWTLAMHAASSSTNRKLRSWPWDAVLLQEQSDGMLPERFASAHDIAGRVEGRAIFFMTWRDRDAPLEEYDTLRGVPGGDIGYVAIAAELDAAVAPVGWVFREILLDEPGADLWRTDGHHASERGRYVAALTLFAAITGESTVGLWVSPRLDPGQALHDQILVDSIVLDNAANWNFE